MDNLRGRGLEVIEGDFEVIEEREAVEVYRNSGGGYIEMDPNPPYVTYAILAINVVVWLVMSFTGLLFGWDLNTQLLWFGAKVNILIVQGQYWRLFTAMILHIGIMHLFFNSYALFIYGPIVEKLYGKTKFAVVYIVSGLLGSLASYVFSLNPAAGASGAIFGLMGSLLYFRQRKRNLFQRVFGPGFIVIIGINLFYGFIQPGIDNWGHIGGLLGGFLTGNAIGLYRERRVKLNRILIWLLIAVLFITGLWYGQFKYGTELYLGKAYDALRYGDTQKAEEYIEKLAAGSLKDNRVKEILQTFYINKAEEALKTGNVVEAINAVNTLIDYYPEDINYLFVRAQIYEHQNNYQLALDDYLDILRTEQNSGKIWYHAARAAYKTGKIADAKKYVQKAIELEPGLREAIELLRELNNVI